jgi:putative endonuclease
MTESRQEFGRRAEDWACRALAREGVRVMARNWSCRIGEIDVVGLERSTVCIVEVKARTSGTWDAPAEAVDRRKQRKLIQLARWYVREKRLGMAFLRFDVVEVFRDKRGNLDGRVIKGAFAEER